MILFFFPCHAVDSDLHSFPTRRSSDLVPQPPHNYQPGYIPVAQPGTLPLRPLGLGDYFNSLFSTLRKSRSEEHTSELQSRFDLVCRLLLEKKKSITILLILRTYRIRI